MFFFLLKLYKQFYQHYPQIKQIAFARLKESNQTFQIGQTLSAQFEVETPTDMKKKIRRS
jgi:hypothetical protein